MRFTYKKITIISSVREPDFSNVDQELQWLGTSIGLFGIRDKDRSCYRIFIALIKALKTNKGLTSDELAYSLGLTRATVIHHLKSLISANIIKENNNRYYIKEKSLKKLLESMKSEMEKTYNKLINIAENIDEKLGLEQL